MRASKSWACARCSTSAPDFPGPLAALEALSAACTTPWLLTVPVDVQRIPDDLPDALRGAVARDGVVVKDATGLQPLIGAVAHGGAAGARCASCSRPVSPRRTGWCRAWTWRAWTLAAPAGQPQHPRRPAGRRRAMSHDFPTRISFARAQEIVQAVALAHPMDVERQPLSRALGRVLAQDVVAHAGLARLRQLRDGRLRRCAVPTATRRGDWWANSSPAPRWASRWPRASACASPPARAMPDGADAVVMKENARVDGETVVPTQAAQGRAARAPPGEDVAVGDTVLRAGAVLDASKLSLAASLGHHDLPVRRRPTVAVFTTGDELRAPGQPLAPGEIYDSNRVLLQALLIAEGYEPVAWPMLPDDPDAHGRRAARTPRFHSTWCSPAAACRRARRISCRRCCSARARCISGRCGCSPGMPVLFGRLGEAHFLGLPGNPVSVLATFLTLARAAAGRAAGQGAAAAPVARTAHGRRGEDARRAWSSCAASLACDDDRPAAGDAQSRRRVAPPARGRVVQRAGGAGRGRRPMARGHADGRAALRRPGRRPLDCRPWPSGKSRRHRRANARRRAPCWWTCASPTNTHWARLRRPCACRAPRSRPTRRPPRRTPASELLLICAGGVRSLAAAQVAAGAGLRQRVVRGRRLPGLARGRPADGRAPRRRLQERYSRHLRLPQVGIEGQEKLEQSRVLMVGAGGLGSPAAFTWPRPASASLRLVDDDVVDRSNLQRQVLHTEARIGMPKVESAALACRRSTRACASKPCRRG